MASKEEVKSLCEEYISGKSESHIPQTIATGLIMNKVAMADHFMIAFLLRH